MSGGTLLLISIVGIPVISFLLVRDVLFESPVALSVTPTNVEAVYRLPWRHMSIELAHVNDVSLVHRKYRGNGGFMYDSYKMTISHDGVVTEIPCDGSQWYQEQLKAAYEALKLYKVK